MVITSFGPGIKLHMFGAPLVYLDAPGVPLVYLVYLWCTLKNIGSTFEKHWSIPC